MFIKSTMKYGTKIVDPLEAIKIGQNFGEPKFPRLFGMDIIETPYLPIPKIEINPEFKWITPEARKEINKSLLDNFGAIDAMIVSPNGKPAVMISSRAASRLKRGIIPEIHK